MYGVISSTTRKLKKLYGSISSTTREIKKVYGVVGGVTKLIYNSSISISYPFYFIRNANTGNIDDYLQNGATMYPTSSNIAGMCTNCGSSYILSSWSFRSASNDSSGTSRLLYINASDHYYNTVNTTGKYYLECNEGYSISMVYCELPKINGSYNYLVGHKICIDARNLDGTAVNNSGNVVGMIGVTTTWSLSGSVHKYTISSINNGFDTVKIRFGGRYLNYVLYAVYLEE